MGIHCLAARKTWRGLVAAIVLATCASVLIGLRWQAGAFAGAFAMAGDCLSSFIKRRQGVGPSGKSLGLDQVPESLLPAFACQLYLPLGYFDIAAVVLLFFIGQMCYHVCLSGLVCVTSLIDWRPARVGVG